VNVSVLDDPYSWVLQREKLKSCGLKSQGTGIPKGCDYISTGGFGGSQKNGTETGNSRVGGKTE
jgi:hypothetical protein